MYTANTMASAMEALGLSLPGSASNPAESKEKAEETNAILHLLAIAHAAEVDLTIDDFNRIQEKVPHLADLKPSGRYVMQDLYKAGGVQGVMKMLHREGSAMSDRRADRVCRKCSPFRAFLSARASVRRLHCSRMAVSQAERMDLSSDISSPEAKEGGSIAGFNIKKEYNYSKP